MTNKDGPIPPEIDLSDPELQLELELRVVGDDVEFRVWAVGTKRPDSPQLVFRDERTYRAGMSSILFSHRNDPVRIYSFCVSEVDSPVLFNRGDCNGDGTVDISDPVANLGFQFLGIFEPPCLDALDFDDSGIIDVTDPIASLTHQFVGGPPPPAPPAPGKDACGVDPSADHLTCERFAACRGNG